MKTLPVSPGKIRADEERIKRVYLGTNRINRILAYPIPFVVMNSERKGGGKITRKIATLWKIHEEHQVIFKQIMKKDISGDLRRVCSQGYMISLLCNREIISLYRSLKCPLYDKDPKVGVGESANLAKWLEVCEKEALQKYLKRKQVFLLKKYLGLVKHLQDNDEHVRVLTDHIHVIKRLLLRLTFLRKPSDAAVPEDY